MLSCGVAARGDLLGIAAAQHVGHVRRAEALPDPRHARQDLPRQHDRLRHRLELAEAVVAGLAAVALVRSRRSSRRCGGGGSRRARRSAPCRASACGARRLSSPFRSSMTRHFRKSAADVISTHSASRPSRPGAAGLLLIVLERLRRAGMHHEPHVGAVDAHAERDRRHDDVDLFVEERILVVDGAPRPPARRGTAARGGLRRAATRRARRPRAATGSRRSRPDRGAARGRRESGASGSRAAGRDRRGSADRTTRPAGPGRSGRAATRCRAGRARSPSR